MITSPPDDTDFELQDVVLDWDPVPGAVSYDVQVATNADFSQGSLIDGAAGILGTRYSPPITYDNNQYFWRVRAIDTAGQPTPWTAARYNFNRTWPQTPDARLPGGRRHRGRAGAALLPVDPGGARLGVRVPGRHPGELHRRHVRALPRRRHDVHARHVRRQHHRHPDRRSARTRTASRQAGEINYWRVRALDRPFTKTGDIPGVQGIFSETQAFSYLPLTASPTWHPRGGQTVDVPDAAAGSPAVGAETYTVTI